ncbi:hypothetical protein AV530_000471 [Patagioenas fasciata monilis]|uniref:PH domain-containing protein n=1 Tax=Patagioenas fasciata monilis TaxID=372326 RepID=A0A1V4K4S2_PATFA|nr:hypothetical protein AV530_000471 [Patagioenas fasciata monilis]
MSAHKILRDCHQEQVLNDTVDGKEIYNTIRRKTKDAFYKNIVKKGYLLKKSKGKRWKNLYFILEGNDAQLIYFESEKRATKPKGLIDLSVCSVYGVHDSLFGRPNCFQIVVQHFSEEHYIFYFAGETPEQAQDWMKALQIFCSLRKNSPGTSNKRLRQVKLYRYGGGEVVLLQNDDDTSQNSPFNNRKSCMYL